MNGKPCTGTSEPIYASLNVRDYVDKNQNEQHNDLFDEESARELDILADKEYEKAYWESFKTSS